MTLKEARERLKAAGIDDPLFEARLIFSSVGGLAESELLLRDAECDDPRVTDAIERRERRVPLQYIIGEVGFYRESYLVDERVLIPRPDTETLVEEAVRLLPKNSRFLDLCTGSGCVAISTLAARQELTAVAADISEGALELAALNARRNGVADRLELQRLDVLKEAVEGRFSAVLSNPPYVSRSAYGSLDAEIYYEPRMAFVGGEDGGDFYRAITAAYRDRLEDGGFIAYEIGYDQGELIKGIAADNRMSAEIKKDLAGRDRVAILRPTA